MTALRRKLDLLESEEEVRKKSAAHILTVEDQNFLLHFSTVIPQRFQSDLLTSGPF